jgi:WS/DGAT/MGAT family acyltransferase
MSYSHYDRFSSMDAAFLDLEDGNAHMHVGWIGIFDAGPLTAEGGGFEFDRIIEFAGAAIQKDVRFQQKIAHVPVLMQPVWIDDDKFNLRYHVRHTCLPAPGSERLLKRLAGRIMSEDLDRGKPLWELWFVEGVEGNRFAVISKIHRSLADEVSGVGSLSAFLDPDPDHRAKTTGAWMPRPAPDGGRLLLDELTRRANIPLSLLRTGARAISAPRKTLSTLQDAAVGLGQAAKAGLVPASETPFNSPLGPHRRFDWARSEIGDMRQVEQRFGGTLNDVVLAVVAGAVRRFFIGRGLRVDDLDFRALVPVNLRRDAERGAQGDRVSTLLAPLPLDEPDPCRRLRRVVETLRALKESKQRHGGEMVAEIADRTFNGLMVRFARFGLHNRAANLVVANAAGPPKPVYLLGAKMLEVYPVTSLGSDQTLGVALVRYAGGLYWGFNSDWDVLPDLHDFVEGVHSEFEELRAVIAEPVPGTSEAADGEADEPAPGAGSARLSG